MQSRTMGRSGLQVSTLTLGTMNWGSQVMQDDARLLLEDYLDAGGTTIDTAYGYGDGASESLIGELIADLHRDDLVLVGKAGISRRTGERVVDTSRRGLLTQLEESLRRLRTDRLDLWLVHTWSDEVPWEETLGALDHAVRSGAARYVGVSNYTGWQSAMVAQEAHHQRIPLVCNQIQYSLLARAAENEIIPAATATGLGVMAWSPLAGGVLSGKYRSGVPADSRAHTGDHPRWAAQMLPAADGPVMKAVATAAEGLDVSQTEVALAWLRERPGVSTAVVGARRQGQLRAALAAQQLHIADAVRDALDDVSIPSMS
ncbi:aldo/keto reductase [Yimella sp. cx-51]|uniref:aldo/keto reductase n=1 Tax=Yimella sp. cx-51 TaxID=2770551 RepID=UPI00165D537C|nr:aldo/keto reductase [Yimella sp. cx-51]MBC9957372.1 aldo/keto reductase [Yimella sp. cx-51]QTH39387.1 aldo/keto reductase [Yimella sp. cx-51]